jgi:hypothetical protein
VQIDRYLDEESPNTLICEIIEEERKMIDFNRGLKDRDLELDFFLFLQNNHRDEYMVSMV